MRNLAEPEASVVGVGPLVSQRIPDRLYLDVGLASFGLAVALRPSGGGQVISRFTQFGGFGFRLRWLSNYSRWLWNLVMGFLVVVAGVFFVVIVVIVAGTCEKLWCLRSSNVFLRFDGAIRIFRFFQGWNIRSRAILMRRSSCSGASHRIFVSRIYQGGLVGAWLLINSHVVDSKGNWSRHSDVTIDNGWRA